MPLTTRPLSTSKHGITRLVSMAIHLTGCGSGFRLAPDGEKVDAQVCKRVEAVDDTLEADAECVRGRAERQVLGLRLELEQLFDPQPSALVEAAQARCGVRAVDGREDVVRIDASPAVVA